MVVAPSPDGDFIETGVPFVASALLGSAIKDAVEKAIRKTLDEMFVFIDAEETPLVAAIRDQGDTGKDLLRGVLLTLAEFEKRLPPAKDQAA